MRIVERWEVSFFQRAVMRALILCLLAFTSDLPALAATDTVTSLADDGSPGTLRSVIAAAAPGDTINFSVTGAITLNCPLGQFTGSLVIGQNLTISGPGAANLTINGVDNEENGGAGACPVFVIPAGVTATISGVSIVGGFGWSQGGNPPSAAYYCGGIGSFGNLTVSNATLSYNFGATAGAICNLGGVMTVNNSTFVHNGPQNGTITNMGGTLTVNNSTFTGSYGPTGGAILNVSGGNLIVNGSTFSNNTDATIDNVTGATATVSNSTFSGNLVGITNSGTLGITSSTIASNNSVGLSSSGTLTVTNSTISGNSDFGIVVTGGTAGVIFSTLSNNFIATPTLGGGSGCGACSVWLSAGTLTLKNTIVASTSTAGDGLLCRGGTIVDGGGNLSWPDTSCPGLNADPVLGPLQNNGGSTQTIALLPGSRALDVVPVAKCTDLSGNPVIMDQRGVTRPQGPACDIGAFELVETGPGPVSTTTAISSNPDSSNVGQSVLLTASVSSWAGGTPTGTITFEFGYGGVIGTAPLSGGQASLNYTFQVASTASIVAIYSGDSNFLTSTSPTLSQIIVPLGLQQAKMIAQDGGTNYQFGASVALSDDGSTALVGAPGHAGGGAAYVFTNSGSGWDLQQELTGDAGDAFGQAVALSSDGNTALVGAPDNSAIYVFTRSGGSWTQTQKLTGTAGDRFGWSVALSSDGSTALVGAIWTTVSSNSQGAAYVFTKSGGSWGQQQELLASDAATNDRFGFDVALSSNGSTALVGSYNKAAYVFSQTGGTWIQQQELTPSNGSSGDIFGISVALSGDGNTAMVGASQEYLTGYDVGGVFVFARTGTTWTQQQELSASDKASPDLFGISVALSRDGTTALVGADDKKIGSNAQQGAAYVFSNMNGNWSQQQELTAWDGASEDFLGTSVALSSNGNTALVGAPGNINGSTKPGAVYVFTNRSSTSIASSLNPSIFGQSVTLTATVAAQSGSAIPTGTLTFLDGSVPLASLALTNGSATLTTSALVGGTHNIIASYSGDSNFAMSTSPVLVEQVLPSSTQIGVVSSLNPASLGQPVTFTATVSSAFSSTSATGSVTFFDGSTSLATVSLTTWAAALTTNTLSTGGHTITASYTGDSNFAASTSPPLLESISANQVLVHFVGAGSSAMFQSFAVAAVNDIAPKILNGAACTTAGDTCTVHHWSIKASDGNFPNDAGLVDGRSNTIPTEFGSLWVVWVDCFGPGCPANTGANGATDVWAYLSVNSTVGVRSYLGRTASGTPASLFLANAAAVSSNEIADSLFVAPANVPDDSTLQADVITALSGTAVTAAMTDIRPEDALLATRRVLKVCGSAGCGSSAPPMNTCPSSDTGIPGAASPICSNYPYFYSFSLGYGPGPVGTQILSYYSATRVTPVSFALPGFPDPITSRNVPTTINVFAIGESPIVLLANRSNASGLGQIIGNISACNGRNNGTDNVICVNDPANGGPVANGGSGAGYRSDDSYFVRNLWDQHPFPPVANTFPSTLYSPSNAGSGYCGNAANSASAECHITRRPLGNLFAGNLCEGRNTAFSWPLDSALEGTRTIVPNGPDFPVNLILQDPLSGAYNAFEYGEVRRFGATVGNQTLSISGLYGKPPYISQESNAQTSAGAAYNPLSAACQSGFADLDTEGFRSRAIGTEEAVSAVASHADSIGYAFFSFGNVSSIAKNQSYGYLMINGVDPLFADYSNVAGNPGQPANPGNPRTWGELPSCTVGGTPECTTNTIWNGLSYPHLRDGTYPAWSEFRMLCDTASPNCSAGMDAFGAEALVQNLQFDIHHNNLGGVPDLLPFSDAQPPSPLAFNYPYGDVAYIRDHFAYLTADDSQEFNNGPGASYINTVPQTTHQSIPAVSLACSGGVPVNAPPTSECGGDVGGYILPAGTANKGGQLQ